MAVGGTGQQNGAVFVAAQTKEAKQIIRGGVGRQHAFVVRCDCEEAMPLDASEGRYKPGSGAMGYVRAMRRRRTQ